jgi:protein-tyrosine-phosphatase
LAARLPGVVVETAGTLTVDGQPMSWRTRSALEAVGLAQPSHRSRQASPADLDNATLIIGLAPEHVHWVRRNHGPAAARTGTLKRLCRDLPSDNRPLAERVAGLDLDNVALEEWEEVVDPGGGEVEVFIACAHEIFDLVERLASVLPAAAERGKLH